MKAKDDLLVINGALSAALDGVNENLVKPVDTIVELPSAVKETVDKMFSDGEQLGYEAGFEAGQAAGGGGYDTGFKDGQIALLESSKYMHGTATGELVSLKDVSPVEHTVGVVVSSKNLANKDAFVDYPSVRKYLPIELDAGTYYYSSNLHASSGVTFWTGIVPDGAVDYTGGYIASFSTFGGTQDEGAFTISKSGTYRFLVYCSNADIRAALENAWGSVWIQIERGTTATPYTPYLADTSAAKIQVLGKNLLPFPYKDGNKVHNGITWTVNDDGTVTANGTASGDSFFLLVDTPQYTATNGIPYCVASGCPSGGSADTYHILSVMTGHRDIGNGLGISATPSYFRFRIIIKNGYTADNLVFSPQVEAAPKNVNVKTPYEPYKAPVEYAQGESVKSIHPTMNIMTDTEGASVDVEYLRDIDAYIDNLVGAAAVMTLEEEEE